MTIIAIDNYVTWFFIPALGQYETLNGLNQLQFRPCVYHDNGLTVCRSIPRGRGPASKRSTSTDCLSPKRIERPPERSSRRSAASGTRSPRSASTTSALPPRRAAGPARRGRGARLRERRKGKSSVNESMFPVSTNSASKSLCWNKSNSSPPLRIWRFLIA